MRKKLLGFATKWVAVVFLTALASMISLHAASASAAIPKYEHALQLINYVRIDPLAHLPEIGIELSEILENRPGLASFLATKMPTLESDYRLEWATGFCLQEKAYASGEYCPEQACRALNEKYKFQVFSPGHTWAFIEFTNFIKPEKAKKILVTQMVVDELKNKDVDEFVLLDPFARKAGVVFTKGKFNGKSRSQNGYSFSIFTAVDASYMREGTLEVLVNEFRQGPMGLAREIGVDTQKLAARLGDSKALLYKRAHPLAQDMDLSEAALELAKYMATRHTVKIGEANLLTALAPFLDSHGFHPDRVSVLAQLVEITKNQGPTEEAESIFRHILEDQDVGIKNIKKITSSLVSEMAFRTVSFKMEQDKSYAVVVGLFAHPRQTRQHVLGKMRTFLWENEQSCLDEGPDGYATAYNPEQDEHQISAIDPLGRFQFRLPKINLPVAAFDVLIRAKTDDDVIQKTVFISDKNIRTVITNNN